MPFRVSVLIVVFATVALTAARVPGSQFRTVIGQEIGQQSGSLIWRVAGAAKGKPASDGRTAYFLTPTHEVVAIEARTGRPRWRNQTGETGATTSGSSLALVGSILVAGDYNVIGFDTRTGALKWRFVPIHGYGPGLYMGAAEDGVVYAGSPAGRVYAIEAQTGTLRWSTVIAADGKTTVFDPITRDGMVVASYTTFTAPNTGGIVGLDRATGRERWRAQYAAVDSSAPSGAVGGPLFVDDTVVAASGTGAIHAFDRATGKIRWSLPAEEQTTNRPDEPPRSGFRALAQTGRTLIAASLSGRVVAYDKNTQQRVWSYNGVPKGSAGIRLAGDEQTVYVPYLSGVLVALNAADGSERWTRGNWKAGFVSAPLIERDRLYIGATDGFYCLRR